MKSALLIYWSRQSRQQKFILLIAPIMPLGWLALAIIAWLYP